MKNLSVIIPTINRCDLLLITLESIVNQGLLPFEVIIIDQNDTQLCEDTVKLFWKSKEVKSVKLKYIRTPDIKSSTKSRNIGIEAAEGDILLFLDDDVILERSFIEEIVKGYEAVPDAGGISGVITNYIRPSFRDRLWRSIYFRGSFRDERQDFYWSANEGCKDGFVRINKLGGGLMGFPRKILETYRFDERLDGYAFGEDIELSYRISKSFPLYINFRARLEHVRAPGRREEIPYIYMVMKFNTYFYYHLLKGNFNDTCSFYWLCAGMFFQSVVRSVKMLEISPIIQFAQGVKDGFVLSQGLR